MKGLGRSGGSNDEERSRLESGSEGGWESGLKRGWQSGSRGGRESGRLVFLRRQELMRGCGP